MEYCCHVWAGAPSCYLEMLDKLQKWVCRTTLAHHRTVDSLSLFHRYYFARCSYERLNWLYFLILMEGPLVILIDCMIFLSPFLDVIGISMSAVSGLVLLQKFAVTLEDPVILIDCMIFLLPFLDVIRSLCQQFLGWCYFKNLLLLWKTQLF